MINKNFNFKSRDDTNIFVYRWIPENVKIRGIVQIAHGMAERAKRYQDFAKVLTENGFVVYANDHRGHGKTAGSIENLGYLGDQEGFNLLVEDVHHLTMIIKEEYPNLPLFLFGHSMGSFVAQRYIMLYGNEVHGLILSGSNGKQGVMLSIGALISKWEVKKHGAKAQSPRLDKLTFGDFNKAFKPNRTEFDWLSRDNREVDKYINDPYCGTVFTAGFFYDFFNGLKTVEDKKNLNSIPRDIPIYIFSGEKDPVGKFGKGVLNLYNRYKDLGVKDISYKLYKDGRHEMLKEINKKQVMEDVVQWLNLHTIN